MHAFMPREAPKRMTLADMILAKIKEKEEGVTDQPEMDESGVNMWGVCPLNVLGCRVENACIFLC